MNNDTYQWNGETVARQIQAFDRVMQIMAHDLNNLLGIITGNLSLLRITLPDDDTAPLEMLDDAEMAAERMVERLRTGTLPSAIGTPCPRSITAAELMAMAADGLPEISCSGSGKLNVAAQPVRLYVDPDQMVQALQHGLRNAAEAVANKGEISFTAAPDSHTHARITISDNGPGIEPAILPRVFGPFATTLPKGHGLGLPIARLLVERNGGSLQLETRCGAGTQLHFDLPRQHDDQ